MAKHVVVDSIARSGTTLLSALLRSQDKTMAFCPGFNEPLSCSNIADWPHGVCRQEFMQAAEIDLKKFKEESLSQIIDYAQYYGLSKDEWRSIIFDADSPESVRENIEKAFPEVDVFCYRWNQSLFYFYQWQNKGENHLWLSMIRNPLDRAISSFEKHRWEYEDSLINTIAFLDKAEIAKQSSQFKTFYYEDLVENGKEQIKKMYDFFGVELNGINLTDIKGSNGEDFIPQSSKIKNVNEKKDGYLTDAEKFSGLYKSGIDRYKTATYKLDNGKEKPLMSEETRGVFKHYLLGSPEYGRYFK